MTAYDDLIASLGAAQNATRARDREGALGFRQQARADAPIAIAEELHRIANALERLAACATPDSSAGYPSAFTTAVIR